MTDATIAAPQDEASEADTRPWARYIAKMVDVAIFTVPYLAVMFAIGAVLGAIAVASGNQALMDLLTGTSTATIVLWWGVGLLFWVLTWPFAEAGIVSSFGTTPGKWLMGISVRTAEGNKLPYWTSFRRSFGALTFGLALGIPVVALITLIMSYTALTANGRTRWDERTGAVTRTRPVGPVRWTLGIVLFAIGRAVDVALNYLS